MTDWIAVALTVLTMAGAVTTWWLREGSRRARNEAVAARDDARAQREAAEKQAAALQQLADVVAAQASAPPWDLTHNEGDTYLLVNESPQRQFDVEVDPVGFMKVARGEYAWQEIGPRESRKFFSVRTMQSAGGNVKVTWAHHPGGPTQTWENPLPPKP